MKAVLVYGIALAIGLGVGWLIGLNGPMWQGLSVTFLCALVAFLINWIVFIPSWLGRTERFYDLTGAATYLSVVVIALSLSSTMTLPGLIIAAMVAIWSLRLGGMLFLRVSRAGEDVRFAQIKTNFIRFFGAWTLQGLWVVLTLACVLVALTHQDELAFNAFFIVGALLWAIGFVCEVVADNQKSQFKANPDNRGKFITTGLWSWSQHPNYFGEILLWTGIAIMTLPILEGWTWIALISPLFVTFLLTKVSGIPMLDDIAKKRWGDDPAYIAYTKNTSKLIPMPPRSQGETA